MSQGKWVTSGLAIVVFCVCAYAGAKFANSMLEYTPPMADTSMSARAFEQGRQSAAPAPDETSQHPAITSTPEAPVDPRASDDERAQGR